jgi:hypothetical protein
MPNAPTPNLGLTVPTVGGDFNMWGGELNTDLAILDGLGSAAIFSPSINFPVQFGTFPETFVMAASGALGITVTLPPAATVPGRIVTVKKVDAVFANVTVAPIAGTIDGNATYLLGNQYQYVRVLSDGSNWKIVGNN